MNNEIIDGIFYQQELQKTKNNSEVYDIEKIVKKNRNMYLTKWRGYSDDFNSWIDKDDVVKIHEYVIFKYAISKKHDITTIL